MIGAIVVKKKIRASFDCLNHRDLDGFLVNWAEETQFVYPGNIPVSGEFEGKEAVREWFQRFLDRFPGIVFALNSVCVKNTCALGLTNVVMAEWDIVLNDHEGQEIRNNGVSVVNLKRGKATLVRTYLLDLEVDRKAWGAN